MFYNLDTGEKIAVNVARADTLWTRFLGLMPRKSLLQDEGLLLTPCNGVHTFFMRFEIDIIYLDSDFKIIDLFEKVKPWRVLPIRNKAKHVLELPAGLIELTGTRKGQTIISNKILDCD